MSLTWWGVGGPSRAAAGADTGPTIDAAARAAYKRRLIDLEDEIETAARTPISAGLAGSRPRRSFSPPSWPPARGLGGRPG